MNAFPLLVAWACAPGGAHTAAPGGEATLTGSATGGAPTATATTASGATGTAATATTASGATGGGPDPFADAVVSFLPGEGAGFGQEDFPEVVLGGPEGDGEVPSTDVLSLGTAGEIVLRFDDELAVDGPGADLIVFENPFTGWVETGEVSVSEDGETWWTFPCDPLDADGGWPGCAGVEPVYANSDNGLDPTDPEAAGGDAFDLADLGVARARYVRIRDTGTNPGGSPTAGFDLDAVAVVNGEPVESTGDSR